MDTILKKLVPELFRRIPVFRVGKHTDSSGEEKDWSDAKLEQLVANFQPNTFTVPVVLGHQTADYSPAQGWVAFLEKKGELVYATLANILEDFAISFKNKQYPNRSVAIDETDQGPVLRHLAFLGAAAPAIDLPPILQFKRYLSSHVYPLPLPLESSELAAMTCETNTDPADPITQNFSSLATSVANTTEANASEITQLLQYLKNLNQFGFQPFLTGEPPMPTPTSLVATTGTTATTDSTEMAAPPFPPKKPTTDNISDGDTTEMAASTQEYELPITMAPPQMQPMQPPPPSTPPVIPAGMVLMSEAERNALLTQGIASACDALLSSAKLFIEQLKVAGKITPAVIDELAEFICFLEKMDSPNPIFTYAAQTGQNDRAFNYFDKTQGRQVRVRPSDYFRKFLANLPSQVQIGRQGHDYSAAVPSSPTTFQPNSANTAFVVSEVLKQIHGGN